VTTRVRIDRDLCIGTAECARLAPQVFRLDEARGVSIALRAAETVDREVLAEAAFNCPTRAITVEDSA
jgi:ferredoxin